MADTVGLQTRRRRTIISWGLLLIAALLGLYGISIANYTLFHALVDLFSALIALSIFIFAWNSRGYLEHNFLVFLGIASLFVGATDMLHSFTGTLGMFQGDLANIGTQLWLCARILQAASWLLAGLLIGHRTNEPLTLAGYLVAFILMVYSIFWWRNFPVVVAPNGLPTRAEFALEYVMCGLMLVALVVLIVRGKRLEGRLYELLLGSAAANLGAMICFALFVDIHDLYNFAGHYLKIISFALLYTAVIERGMARPLGLMFQDLQRTQEELRQERELLEERVRERTTELSTANELLRAEIEEHARADRARAHSEARFRDLIETAKTAILQFDLQGRVQLLNRFGEELFGWKEEELLGKDVNLIVPPEEQSGRSLEGMISAIIASPAAYEANENENITRDGHRLWMAWSNQGVYDEAGNLVGVLSIGTDRTVEKAARQELLENQERLRSVASELVLAEERERRRLATEIHDNLSQTLAVARLKLQALEHEEQAEPLAEQLKALDELLEEAVANTRSITFDLSPPILYQVGLSAAIEWLGEQTQQRHGIQVHFHDDGEDKPLTEDVRTIVFQATREIFANLVKHAQARNVWVKVQALAGTLLVQVKDDGVGFAQEETQWSAHKPSGFGLFNIRERLNYVCGSVNIRSAPGQGTSVTLMAPLATQRLELSETSCEEHKKSAPVGALS